LKYINPVSGSHLTEKKIRRFIDDYLGGKLRPRLVSEPEPSDDYIKNHAVTKVVGTTWRSIVLDPTCDVFILYYIDWDDRCNEFLSKWNGVALALYGIKPFLNIASFNWGLNEVENQIKIPGFPALVFYPANDKDDPVVYHGDFSVKDIYEFIILKRSMDWDLPPRMKEVAFIDPEEPEDVFFEDETISIEFSGDELFGNDKKEEKANTSSDNKKEKTVTEDETVFDTEEEEIVYADYKKEEKENTGDDNKDAFGFVFDDEEVLFDDKDNNNIPKEEL